ncbi:MAG TPA: DUF362 domain-containing protein [Armatimonadota bacterium]|nr:DUF362 domain-containing protein [Armatimonadota bacterium]
MEKSKVAVLKTRPETVLDDINRLMKMADYEKHLPKDKDTILKINISWHYYYPACSTTPWQLDGVTKTLRESGYKNLIPAQNRTVVVDPKAGAKNNHLESVIDKHGLEFVYLYEEGSEWIKYEPKSEMLVLDKVFPDGILIPKMFIDKNAVHLPTLKTHVFTTMTGAMKNAFGGLLRENRHWTHSVIHETLVDLLAIQKEIHPGIFAVTDGTIAGDGPGPRAMVPYVKDYILASADQVAIDAVAAKMMGFDPLELKFIRLAHERGLGCGDVKEIEIVGEDISDVNFHFHGKQETFASRGQKLIYHGPLKPLENILLRSFIAPWSYYASRLYYDGYWYRCIGKKRVKQMLETHWGKLFQQYGR